MASSGNTDVSASAIASAEASTLTLNDSISQALGLDAAARVLGKLLTLTPRLVGVLDVGAREFGLTYARGKAVAALRISGPAPMRVLSDALGVAPRTVTGLIDALEADGWVERRAHKTDRRVTIVGLTPAAQAAFTRLDQAYRALAYDLLGEVPEADLQCASAVIDHITARLDEAVSTALASLAADPPANPSGQPVAD